MGLLNANVIYIKIEINGRVEVKMNVYSEQQQSKSSEKGRFRDLQKTKLAITSTQALAASAKFRKKTSQLSSAPLEIALTRLQGI